MEISQIGSGRAYYEITGDDGTKYIYSPKEFVESGFVQGKNQFYDADFLNSSGKNLLSKASTFDLPESFSLNSTAQKLYENPNSGYLWKKDDYVKAGGNDSFGLYEITDTHPAITGLGVVDGALVYGTSAAPGQNSTYINTWDSKTGSTNFRSTRYYNKGLFGSDFLGDLGMGIKDTLKELGPIAPIALAVIAPQLAASIGTTLGATTAAGAATLGNAVIGGSLAAMTDQDIFQGAVLGGAAGGLSQATPVLSEALGGSVAGQAATGAIIGGAKAALTGGDVLESALKSAAMSGAAAATFEPQLPTESYDYASDAGLLAEQGIGAGQIADILGAAGAAPDLAGSLASSAINAVGLGLTGADVANYINNEFTADVQFAAADANQLFNQGLSNAQVGQTIDATGVPSSVSSLGQDASFIAADAQQLWKQTNNVGAVEQNLLATGLDPIVAATVANEVAMGASANDLTDILLQASDPATLTTENTLFSENNMLPTSADLSPIKTSVVKPTETIPAVQAQQQQQPQQQSSLVNDVFLIDPNRNTLFQNPFLRSSQSYQSIVGGLFNG